MADNQQSNQKPQDQKPGLTWSQPSGAQRNAQPQAKQSTPPAGNESGGRVIGIIVGVVIILALVVWGITALRHRDETVSSNASSTAETANVQKEAGDTPAAQQPAEGTGETIATTPAVTASPTVANASFTTVAQPAGDSVAVTGLSLSQPTWVVVYESRGGKPGNILGAGLFFSGDTAAAVPLMRATVSGQTYFVTEVADNGDKLFSIKDEKPLTDASGAQVWTTFTAQ